MILNKSIVKASRTARSFSYNKASVCALDLQIDGMVFGLFYYMLIHIY